MRLEIGKYYKSTRKGKNWFGGDSEVMIFFRVKNILSIADEDTVSYVGFSKTGVFLNNNRALEDNEKVIEISPMDFYKAYKEYYVANAKEEIDEVRNDIDLAKGRLEEEVDKAKREEKKLLAGLGGVVAFFQNPSVQEVEVKDGQRTE